MRSTRVGVAVVESLTFVISTAGVTAAGRHGESCDTPACVTNPGNDKRVPLYGRLIETNHTVTIDRDGKPGTETGVSVALTCQTCDERIVYPKRTMAVRWTIRAAQPE